MKCIVPGAIIVGIVAVILVSPGAVALFFESLPAPPQNFTGNYDNETHTVELFWDPPMENGDYVYTVYRDGKIVNLTQETAYSEDLITDNNMVESVYWVTAISRTTNQEGPPSQPFFVFGDSICSPIIAGFHPDEDPPVWANIDHRCLAKFERTIKRLISGSPGGEMDIVDPTGLIG